MKKRGQVTAFIVIGLVLLIMVGLFIYLKTSYTTSQLSSERTIDDDIKPIKINIESCLQTVLEEGIPFLAMRGGYYSMPVDSVTTIREGSPLAFDIPYYYTNDEFKAPNDATIKQALVMYVQENALHCFEEDETDMYTLTKGSGTFTTTVDLTETEIQMQVEIPVTVETPEKEATLRFFTVGHPTPYYKMIKTARVIAEKQSTNSPYLCMDCITEEILHAYEMKTEEYRGEETLIISNLVEKEGTNFFAFAGKYTSEQQPQVTFRMQEIPAQEITAEFLETIPLESSTIISEIEIDPSWITFDDQTNNLLLSPKRENVGEHIVSITATDVQGKRDSLYFTVTVNDIANKPDLGFIGSHTITADEEFSFQVEVQNEEELNTVYFTDDTDLFDININTGFISFTPTVEQKGGYHIIITALDESGGSDTENLYLIIT